MSDALQSPSYGWFIDCSSRYALTVDEEEPLVSNARHRAQLEAAQGFLRAFLATGEVFLYAFTNFMLILF